MDQYQRPSNRPSSHRSGRFQKKKRSDFPELLLYYILPFVVFNSILFFCVITKPKATVVVADTNDYLSTEVTLTVDSWFPTRSVTMTLDGEALELEKGKSRTYTTTVYKNGSIEANIVNLNGMPAAVFEHVNVLDDNPPGFETTAILDGVITITFSDSQSGINFDSIYALNSEGARVEPLTVDRNANTISYEMDAAGLQVFAQDKAGNEVQGNFTSHREGSVELLEGGAVDAEGNFIVEEEDEIVDVPIEDVTGEAGTSAAGTSATGTTAAGTTAGTTSGTSASSTTSGTTTSAAGENDDAPTIVIN